MTGWSEPIVVAALLAGLAGWLATGRSGPAARRLTRLTRPTRPTERPSPARPGPPARSSSWVVRLAVAGALVAAISGAGTVAVILGGLGLAAARAGSRRRRAEQSMRAALARDLPRAADLLVSALAAGAAPAVAVEVVGDALGGPVGVRLRPVAAALSGGWELPIPAAGDPAARLVRSFARAAATGAPLAEAVRAIAEEERERARWLALERARTAGVRAVGPLAACFLPAFVLVGVVPVVAGIARALLADWA